MDNKLIRCSDTETIEKLKQNGFQLIEEKDGVAIFLNNADKKINFEHSKVSYTNRLII